MFLNPRNIQAREEFYQVVQENGFKLKSEYITSDEKVKLECEKGHEMIVDPSLFKRTLICDICEGKSAYDSNGIYIANNLEHAKHDFFQAIKQAGYLLLSDYINSILKLKLKCPNNHEWETTPVIFKRGHRCSYCAGNSCDQAKAKFYQALHDCGFIAKSEYVNSRTPITLECNRRHHWEVLPNNFKIRRNCPQCNKLLQKTLTCRFKRRY